jgi:hypothetical protein
LWNIFDFFKFIRFDANYEEFVRGQAAPRKRTRYEEADRRILSIVQKYDANNILEYLRGLAHNFLME